MSTTRNRRPTRAQLDRAYRMSAQGAFEIARRDFHSLRNDPLRRSECIARGQDAITAGEARVAEVAGTQFEAGWQQAVDGMRGLLAQLEQRA